MGSTPARSTPGRSTPGRDPVTAGALALPGDPAGASPTARAAEPSGTARAGAAAPLGARRRDRRGRGLRGPVVPPGLPAHRTRAERFDDLVLDAVERLERRWAKGMRGTEFAVEEVPPSQPAPWERGGIPLGRYFPADAGLPARIVVYRRPLETRAVDEADLAELVRDVLVEQVAHLLARPPEEIDPQYRG